MPNTGAKTWSKLMHLSDCWINSSTIWNDFGRYLEGQLVISCLLNESKLSNDSAKEKLVDFIEKQCTHSIAGQITSSSSILVTTNDSYRLYECVLIKLLVYLIMYIHPIRLWSNDSLF